MKKKYFDMKRVCICVKVVDLRLCFLCFHYFLMLIVGLVSLMQKHYNFHINVMFSFLYFFFHLCSLNKFLEHSNSYCKMVAIDLKTV